MAKISSLIILTVLAFYYDFRYRQLPNWLLVFVLPSLVFHGVTGGLKEALLSLSWAVGCHLLAYLRGWLAGGDVKLALALCLCLGQDFFRAWLFAGLYSGLWGGISLFKKRGLAGFWDLASLLYSGKATSGVSFPYGAALALGTWSALLWRW
jgi:prepilin peptidase CpaA